MKIVNTNQKKPPESLALTRVSGFTLLEIIASTLIIVIVVTGSVSAVISALRVFNQAAAREGLEGVVSEDIAWLRAFSKSWHCEVGPYQGCRIKSQGLASAVNYLPEIYSEDSDSEYQKFKELCLNRSRGSGSMPADQLLIDGAASDSDGVFDPPNPVASGKIQMNLSNAPPASQQYKLYREISTDSEGNSINVSYFLDPSDNPTMGFTKTERLFIEATAWCP